MYDWEFHDDMINLWLFMMNIMIIRLEIQGVFQLGKDWSSIQHSQNCIWEWGVDNVWLGISWWYDRFMIIYDEHNDNKIGNSVKQKLRESWGKRSGSLYLWEEQFIFEDESFLNLFLLGFWLFNNKISSFLFFLQFFECWIELQSFPNHTSSWISNIIIIIYIINNHKSIISSSNSQSYIINSSLTDSIL